MKSKYLSFFAAGLAGLISVFLSCKNPPIFAAIEQEVKLKQASVQGAIVGIVKAGNKVYAANPKTVFSKSLGDNESKWSSMSAPSSWCTSLATEGETLYGSFSGGAYLYNNETRSWQSVENGSAIGKLAGSTPLTGIDSSKTLYKIVKGKAVSLGVKVSGIFLDGAEDFIITNDKIYSVSSGKEVTGNGAPSGGFRGICSRKDGNIFILTTYSLFCYNKKASPPVWTNIPHNLSNPLSITYLENKSLVLIGCESGYGEVKLSSGKNDLENAKMIGPGSQYSTTPPACYHQYKNSIGKWLVSPLCALEHGSGYIIYAGIGGSSSKYTGLWGFYNPGQLEWNRE